MTKQTKTTAKEVAANKVDAAIEKANEELAAMANRFKVNVEGTVGKMQLDVTYKAREVVVRVPDADPKPVINALSKQRRSDAKTIIYASDVDLTAASELFPKSRKPGLQQMGRALKLVSIGIVDETAAKRYLSTGSTSDLNAATGQTPEPVAAPEPVQGKDDAPVAEQRDTDRKNPTESEVGNLKRMAELVEQMAALMPAFDKEMAEYGPECKKAVASFEKLYANTAKQFEAVSKAAAKG